MAQIVRDMMTPNPTTCPDTSTVADAARAMRASDIGDVIVVHDGRACGIVTDRDIVVRTIAEGRDPYYTRLGDICSSDLTSLSPMDSVDDAVRTMRERALRRLPVCDNGSAVGIVTLGDLAVERDPHSALADISAAPANT